MQKHIYRPTHELTDKQTNKLTYTRAKFTNVKTHRHLNSIPVLIAIIKHYRIRKLYGISFGF